MIPRAARRLGLDVEAERGEVQHIDEGIDRADRIVLVDIVVDAVRQEGGLASIQTFDKAFNESPRSYHGNHIMIRQSAHVFTQPLCFADDLSVDALSQKPSLADRASTRGSRPSRMSGVESISTVGHAMRHSDRSLYHFTN